jgi:hypothetical protein
VYFSDSNNWIRKVGPDGHTGMVGGHFCCEPPKHGEGILATETTICPSGVAIGPDCSIYFAEGPCGGQDCCWPKGIVRRIDPEGRLWTVAGVGTCGFSGDGGPATQAQICPGGIAVDQSGVLYMADDGRVRRVGLDGIITTVAGRGGALSRPPEDGSPATAASIDPSAVAVGHDGSLYIADPFWRRIFKVRPDGTITTLAGGGSISCDGRYGIQCDGHLATEARLVQPTDVEVGPEGNVYFVDFAYVYSVFRITRDGVLQRVAGNGTFGDWGDGGPAREAALDGYAISFGPNGSLYIAGQRRIRRVSPER